MPVSKRDCQPKPLLNFADTLAPFHFQFDVVTGEGFLRFKQLKFVVCRQIKLVTTKLCNKYGVKTVPFKAQQRAGRQRINCKLSPQYN